MIKEFKENKEYHKNGTLSYREIIGVIEPIFVDLYKNNKTLHKFNDNENYYIKLFMRSTYDNNQLHWMYEYDESGNITNKSNHYRKDGSVIQY